MTMNLGILFLAALHSIFLYFHFVQEQTSEAGINKALDLWAASILEYGEDTPWSNAQELYATIDNIQHGEAPWRTYKLHYNGLLPEGTPPRWMTDTFELCTRDSRTLLHRQLAMNEFKDKIHYMPYQQFRGDGSRVWSNLMSADWVAKQAVSVKYFYFVVFPQAIHANFYHRI